MDSPEEEVVDPRVAVDLEIPAILARLEERCASRPGRRALPRAPLESAAEAMDRQARVQECRRARTVVGSLRFACEADPRQIRRSAIDGLALPVEDLLAVWDGARAAAEAKEQLKPARNRDGWERLALEVEAVPDLPAFRKACGRTFDIRGGVRDDASPELSRLRAHQRRLEKDIQAELDRIVRGAGKQFLSDEFSTQKGGRWVVPVAADFKGRIPGVVVDASATGQTLYVEPFRVVELSNDMRAARAAEENEILRILTELTRLLGTTRYEALEMGRALAELDALHASAAFADDLEAEEVELLAGRGPLAIRAGRHVLLGKDCVPVDLEVPEGARGLVLSGANAGGKTVALKIFGTLTWLAASGYQVPAGPGTRLPFPRRFACVIGDDQSLAHNLSSFSSHAQSVAAVVAEAGEGDLVLLDELMSGTDPEEGAALAVEVLLELERRGARVVTTTHYTAVKLLGDEHEAFENASVEFDVAALRPTFRVIHGKAGPSRGFEIAGRFGLPDDLVERARVRLGPARARLQDLLSKIEVDRVDAAVALEETQALRAEVDRTRAELLRLQEVLKLERREEAEDRAARFDEEVTELRRKVLAAIEAGRLDEAARAVEQASEAREELPEPPARDGWESLEVGDRVRVGGYGVIGLLTRLERGKKKATVDTGSMTLEVDLTRLEKEGAAAPRSRAVRRPTPAARDPDEPLRLRELQLLGMRVAEARETLEDALDRAAADDLDGLRVVHGFGTGALRGMVDEVARAHPLVESARPGGEHEGGRGATVVVLR